MDFVEWGNKWLEDENEKKKQSHIKSCKTWNEAHPEKMKTIRKKFYANHCEEVKKQVKVWREKNYEKALASARNWKKKNSKKVIAYARSWEQAHPEQTKEIHKRIRNRRHRDLGFVPLNTFFDGSEGHHIDEDYIVYIPKDLHRSIPHSMVTGKNMKEMNKLALDYFEKMKTQRR
jgi:hypothetical protein